MLNDYMDRHSIPRVDYNRLKKEQDNKCVICGKGLDKNKVYIDHDEYSDEPKGLLCFPCFVMIGYCKENKNIFNNIVNYIKIRR